MQGARGGGRVVGIRFPRWRTDIRRRRRLRRVRCRRFIRLLLGGHDVTQPHLGLRRRRLSWLRRRRGRFGWLEDRSSQHRCGAFGGTRFRRRTLTRLRPAELNSGRTAHPRAIQIANRSNRLGRRFFLRWRGRGRFRCRLRGTRNATADLISFVVGEACERRAFPGDTGFLHQINEILTVKAEFFGKRVNAYWHWGGILSSSIDGVRRPY